MAMTLARRLGSPLALAGSAGIGGRVWHAPAPTRYRFAIQSASNKVLLKPNEDLGAEWTASAWAWAPVSTAAATTHPPVWSAGSGEEAMWRAMQDIRKFAERVDKNGQLLASQIQQILKLVEDIRQKSSGKWKYVVGGVAFTALFWYTNYMNVKSITASALHEFLVTTVNQVVIDPETQHNLKMSAHVFVDAAGEKINPLSRIKGLFVDEIEENRLSYSDLVAKDVFLGLSILLLVQLNTRNGTTLDDIMQDLNLIRKDDPIRVMEMMQFLQTVGYVDEVYMGTVGVKEDKKTYWPTFALTRDKNSGVLEKSLRDKIRMKRKSDDKDSQENKIKTPQAE